MSEVMEMSILTENHANIFSIQEFIQFKNIRIPEYQRPYKWQSKTVLQLVEDIRTFHNKPHYRFGSIVIHCNKLQIDDKEKLFYDIVDGQQRYTTLRLIIHALYSLTNQNDKFDKSTRLLLEELHLQLKQIEISYTNKQTAENIYNNYLLLKRATQNFDDKTIHNFIKNFQVVVFFIHDETEAFQFFDSQNSRGKDLYPHDLLKAFHLRELGDEEVERQTQIVEKWESHNSRNLSSLFANFLFRIKRWSSNSHARYFSKEHVDMFKGISFTKIDSYPFVRPLQIAHYFVDEYNVEYKRKIDGNKMSFPFQLDDIMLNGRRFFEFVNHYIGINERFKKEFLKTEKERKELTNSEKLVHLIYHNDFSHREGESYIKSLFECITIYYIDKFGLEEIDSFIERAFVWCFVLRFRYQRIGFDSVDNYVVDHNIFKLVKDALTPKDVMNAGLEFLPKSQKVETILTENARRMDAEIVEFFKQNHYYEN